MQTYTLGAARGRARDIRILNAVVTQARRVRDMGRIEARVEIVLQRPGMAPERRVMQASAPERDAAGRPVRSRLIADAARMATLLPAFQPSATAA